MSIRVLFTGLFTSLTMKATTKLVETARKLVVHISDDPEHAKLVETARKLREQEKEDEDVTKKYQEIYDKSNDPKEEDREQLKWRSPV